MASSSNTSDIIVDSSADVEAEDAFTMVVSSRTKKRRKNRAGSKQLTPRAMYDRTMAELESEWIAKCIGVFDDNRCVSVRKLDIFFRRCSFLRLDSTGAAARSAGEDTLSGTWERIGFA